MNHPTLRALALGLGLLGLALAGCATVGPADKEAFTWPCMDFDKGRPSQPFVGHAYLTLEQADGGGAGEGGGCGCR